jgi:hypothetical protein
MISTTKFFVQWQNAAADFSDGSEPICLGSNLYQSVERFKLCHAHRRLVAITCDFTTNQPTGEGVMELIRV